MPISDEQHAANRANATSTGPRTPQGNARSAQNARKHGFTASDFSVVRLDDLRDVTDLVDDLVATYQSVNSQKLFAPERMAIAQQILLRAARLESGLFTTCLNEALTPDDRPLKLLDKELTGDDDGSVTRAQNRNYLLAEGFHRMARYSNSWPLFMRYHAQCERHYRRAVEEFEPSMAPRPTFRRTQGRLPCQLPPNRLLCQIPGHRRRTPSGSQSQFPTTPIGSTNNWVRSFTLPCPDPDSPSRCRPALESPEPIRSSAVQRNPRKPRIQHPTAFPRPGAPP